MGPQAQAAPQEKKTRRRRSTGKGELHEVLDMAGTIQGLPLRLRESVKDLIRALGSVEPKTRRKRGSGQEEETKR